MKDYDEALDLYRERLSRRVGRWFIRKLESYVGKITRKLK